MVFTLFGRIRIALPAEHFDAAPAVLLFTTSLCPSLIMDVPACCLAMTLSPSFVSHNQAVWARAAGTDWVKLAVDVTIQTNYSYSFWRRYSSEYEYTIRNRSEYSVHPWLLLDGTNIYVKFIFLLLFTTALQVMLYIPFTSLSSEVLFSVTILFRVSRFPGARDSWFFSFPDSRELKRRHSRRKAGPDSDYSAFKRQLLLG